MAKRIGETSYTETAFGIIPRSQLIQLEIEGVKRAWDAVILATEKNKKFTITPASLKRLHKIGFAWIIPEIGGKFRTVNVRVSKHTPPQYYKISVLMEDFSRDLKERTKHLPSIEAENFIDALVDLLAWTHHRFLWIHPFQDYNGRIARLLINVLLLNLQLPGIELQVETPSGRKRYVSALAAADRLDYSKLKHIIFEALQEAVQEIKND